ncbi:conserved hypothetical protein [Shewanella sediminis HAW-EB3]|uniref:Uncharacterized protein n=2 Tax=Shewanella sediminis TaxID=271097 RepID=A8G0P6_SHESH|nr:conserved hypothetical protein [Shewanella sediminis HAW-EB3]
MPEAFRCSLARISILLLSLIYKNNNKKNMNTLFTYINAIHSQESADELVNNVNIVNKETKSDAYLDAGVDAGGGGVIEVSEYEATYHYDNGVVIRHKIERDSAPSELQCEECWISYEVLDSAGQEIEPFRKTFYNSCQEEFWLKMHCDSITV